MRTIQLQLPFRSHNNIHTVTSHGAQRVSTNPLTGARRSTFHTPSKFVCDSRRGAVSYLNAKHNLRWCAELSAAVPSPRKRSKDLFPTLSDCMVRYLFICPTLLDDDKLGRALVTTRFTVHALSFSPSTSSPHFLSRSSTRSLSISSSRSLPIFLFP